MASSRNPDGFAPRDLTTDYVLRGGCRIVPMAGLMARDRLRSCISMLQAGMHGNFLTIYFNRRFICTK
jgi:hypothetical protein